MTEQRIKAMQTALLKYNAWIRRLIAANPEADMSEAKELLKRGEDALRVRVIGPDDAPAQG